MIDQGPAVVFMIDGGTARRVTFGNERLPTVRRVPRCIHRQASLPTVDRWHRTRLRKMPQQPRRKRDNAAASKRKAGNTVTAPLPPRELPQPRGEERKSHLYLLLVFPIVFLIASNSLVTFLYALALDPLYGSIPVHLHLEKVVWAATIAGAFGPVPSLRPSLAILGCLVVAIPASSYWTALYTGKIGDPLIGSTITHLVILFPVIYFGVSLVKRVTVRTYDSSPVFLPRL
jgi:hypothetical protein